MPHPNAQPLAKKPSHFETDRLPRDRETVIKIRQVLRGAYGDMAEYRIAKDLGYDRGTLRTWLLGLYAMPREVAEKIVERLSRRCEGFIERRARETERDMAEIAFAMQVAKELLRK